MNLFQTKIRFLGHNIDQGTVIPIERPIEFANFRMKSEIKKQLQRLLGSLDYVADFCKNLSIICDPLHQILKKTPLPWSLEHTKVV